MADAVFGIFGAFNQVMMIFMGLVFGGIGGLIVGYPLWQMLTWPRVKALVVEVRAQKDPFKEHEKIEEEAPPVVKLKEELESKPSKWVGVTFASLFLIGIPLLFVGVGAYFALDYAILKARGVSAQGTIVRFEEHSSDEGYTYAPVIEFRDREGILREQETRMSSSSKMGLSEGQSINIYYEAENPEHFIIDRFWYNMILPVAFMGMGGFVLFFMVFFGFRKEVPRKDRNVSAQAMTQNIYYAVYEYITPDGRMVRAQDDGGSSSLADKVIGSEVKIFLKKDDYEAPSRPSLLLSFIGLAFLLPGLFVLYQAFTAFDFSIYTVLVMLAGIVFIGVKLSKVIKPKSEWESVGQFKSRMKAKRQSKSAKGVALTKFEVQTLLEQHDRLIMTWTPLYVLIVLGMIVGGAYLYKNQSEFQSVAIATNGEVVRMISKTDSEGSTIYAPMVRFMSADGREIEFKDSVSSNPPSYNVGDEVKVLYPVDDPRDAIIDRGWMNQLPGIGLMGLGGLFFLLTARSFMAAKLRSANRFR